MLRKSFTFILLTLLTCALTNAQETPKSKESKEKKEHKIIESIVSSGSGNNFVFGSRRGYLGVHIKEVTKENFAKYGLSGVRGVAIEKVSKDSPAAKAGLKDNDVIVRFNGESVTSTRKLQRLISEVAPDHTATITVVRNGSEQNLNATIGKPKSAMFRIRSGTFALPTGSYSLRGAAIPRMPRMPRIRVSPNVSGFNFNFSSSRVIGISTSSLSKQLGEHFGVSDGKGILVNNVRKDSPAAKAGFKAGDVIVAIDGKEVKNSFDLTRAISKKKEGAVNLTIVRNKNRQNISVTPEKRKGNRDIYLNRVFELNKKMKSKRKVKSKAKYRFFSREI